jgi:predicted alpha/beta superfamily hydrolase
MNQNQKPSQSFSCWPLPFTLCWVFCFAIAPFSCQSNQSDAIPLTNDPGPTEFGQAWGDTAEHPGSQARSKEKTMETLHSFVTNINYARYATALWQAPVNRRGEVQQLQGIPIAGFKRLRDAWVYLPPGYETSDERYPVLYLMDGQNLFKNETSFAGEWRIDETLDALIAQDRIPEIIVVGLENGQLYRAEEYVLYPFTHSLMTLEKARGMEFARFLALELPQYINTRYRTKSSRDSTYLGGSSFGGLISLTTALYYPDTFGGILAFSNALWPGDYGLTRDYHQLVDTLMADFYLDTGGKEGLGPDQEYKDENFRLFQRVRQINAGRTVFVLQEEASHNELYWARRFTRAIEWLLNPEKDQVFLLTLK